MAIKNQTIKVGISVGDINGIGLELIIKTLKDKKILEFFTPIIYGSTQLLNSQAKNLGVDNVKFKGIKSEKEAQSQAINVKNIASKTPELKPGEATPEAGEYAISSFTTATEALKNGAIDILVTAPFNKDNIQSEKYKHPGHTQYLGEVFGQNPLMVLTAESLTIALVTQHIPLSEVSQKITEEKLMQSARLFYQSLQRDFYINKPKIAVLGLNPHAGDNGLIGKEDQNIIIPAIEKMNQEGILAFGPYAADSFFIPSKYKAFDGVLAMYHDQGLIPFKTIHFQDGVNFTAGISKIRTSPDHGVAYDIAGKGIADETSFKEAIFRGIDFYKARIQDQEDRQDPLEIAANEPHKNNNHTKGNPSKK